MNKTSNAQAYLQMMGIVPWRRRECAQAATTSETLSSASAIANAMSAELTDSWQTLRERALACQLCGLQQTRKQVVFGVGNQQAKLMLIGEAPGASEDQQGLPFVGRAGQLLTAMLQAIFLRREDVYIANILKCRPPHNRDPQPEEVSACTPWLQQQIALIQPKLIVALGRIAAHFLLKTNSSLASLRQQQFSYGEHKVPLLVTYHPAYLLRNPRDKSKAYRDLLSVYELLQQA